MITVIIMGLKERKNYKAKLEALYIKLILCAASYLNQKKQLCHRMMTHYLSLKASPTSNSLLFKGVCLK